MENSIKEDIKIVENYLSNSAINETDSNFFKNGGWEIVDLEIPKSMQHILSDYKRVLKENEEYSKQLDLDYVDKNYIPIQKVKDEKEKLDKKYNELVDKVYKDPLKALTDFQRVVGGQAILNALLKEGET